MKGFSISVLVGAIAAGGLYAPLALGSAADLEQAISLLRETRSDRCQQSSLRSRILVAHQSHDEKTVNDLYPQLEALNARLKPAEDKLKALSKVIQLSSDEQNAYETAQLENGSCE